MLCTVGDLLTDVVVWLAEPPRLGTDARCRIFRRRGGSAANVAAFAASVAGPGHARFVGRVGADVDGDLLVTELRADGVDVAVQRGGRTGTVVVLVAPDGERTMLTDRGCATELDDVDAAVLDGVSTLHLTAYAFAAEPMATAVRELTALANQRSIRITLDLSSVAVLERFTDFRRDVLEPVAPAVVIGTAAEVGCIGPPDGWTVIKRSAAPVIVAAPDGTRTEVAVAPVAGVVDTTGAGDAFAAGFLLALDEHDDPVAAADAGIRLAATVLTTAGATRAPGAA